MLSPWNLWRKGCSKILNLESFSQDILFSFFCERPQGSSARVASFNQLFRDGRHAI